MLVEVGVDLEGAGVQARLVGEGARPDIRLPAVGRDVGDLADRVGDAGGLAQPLRCDERHTLLDLEVGDHGEDVGVAGALAVTVDRALDVSRAGVDRGHRVGHRAAGVVVAVDADPRARGVDDVAHDVGHLRGKHAAIGVAQGDHLGA